MASSTVRDRERLRRRIIRTADQEKLRPSAAEGTTRRDRLRARNLPQVQGRHRSRRLPTIVLGDFLATVGTYLLVADTMPHVVAWSVLVCGLVAMATWEHRGHYQRRFSISALDDAPSVASGVLIGVGAVTMVASPTAPGRYLLVAILLCVGVLCLRVAAYAVVRAANARTASQWPVLIVGAGQTAAMLGARIVHHRSVGLQLVGFLDDGQPALQLPAPVVGTVSDLVDIVLDRQVSNVIVAYGNTNSSDLVQVLRAADRLDLETHVLPRMFELAQPTGSRSDVIGGVPLMRVGSRAHHSRSFIAKRALDLVISGLALVVLAPVLGILALAVRMSVGSGVFFSQARVGFDGREFEIRKFRTMRHADHDVEWGTSANRDRIAPLGAFMRRYSLDELPQLFNVVRGDMSLVGPRPELPEHSRRFTETFRGYGDRLRVPVGLTGLAAVEGLRGDTSISERAYFDNKYIENWSAWLDVKILLRTAMSVIRGSGH